MTVTTTNVVSYNNGGPPEVKAPQVTNETDTYYNLDAMAPSSPFANPLLNNNRFSFMANWSAGCDIELPICASESGWLGVNGRVQPAGSTVPSYTNCKEWPFYFQLPVTICSNAREF